MFLTFFFDMFYIFLKIAKIAKIAKLAKIAKIAKSGGRRRRKPCLLERAPLGHGGVGDWAGCHRRPRWPTSSGHQREGPLARG